MKMQDEETEGLAQLLVGSKHSLSSSHCNKSSTPSIGSLTLRETTYNETSFIIGYLIETRVKFLWYLIHVITKACCMKLRYCLPGPAVVVLLVGAGREFAGDQAAGGWHGECWLAWPGVSGLLGRQAAAEALAWSPGS